MAHSSLIFVLTTEYYYGYPEIPPPIADANLATPVLSFFASADVAAQREEGLSFVEGDVAFFAADGSSLIPKFSREPYINNEKNTYFPGVYTLQLAQNKNLGQVIFERIKQAQFSDDIRIIAMMPEDDESAQFRGWKNADAMEAAIKEALSILPKNLKKLVIF